MYKIRVEVPKTKGESESESERGVNERTVVGGEI